MFSQLKDYPDEKNDGVQLDFASILQECTLEIGKLNIISKKKKT